MKKYAAINLTTSLLLTFICFAVNGQTNVSGKINRNTTWTRSNSPYIVIDTVVVLPGVTLTIQPGVIVKFETNKRLEIRTATLNAIGTVTDSIVFTSNSALPSPGIWSDIYLNGQVGPVYANFSHCNFKYAKDGILCDNYNDNIFITNSIFFKNNTGINGGQWLQIDRCNFIENINGIDITSGTIDSCNFFLNQNGLCSSYIKARDCHIYLNQIGIKNCDVNLLKNCIVESNEIGIYSFGQSGTQNIDSCLIRGNKTGIYIELNWYNSILNCIIDSNSDAGIKLISVINSSVLNCKLTNNGIGLLDRVGSSPNLWLNSDGSSSNLITGNIFENNSFGIELGSAHENIYCNKICNSSNSNLKYTALENTNFANNFWCTLDSSLIQTSIFDGNDSINIGRVNFMPFDTVQCYLCHYILTYFNFSWPSCSTCNDGIATANPYNGISPFTYLWNTFPTQTTQTATGLSNGYHTVCITDATGCTRCDSVYIDYKMQIENKFESFNFSIFPNPSSDYLTLVFPSNIGNAEIDIFNSLGQLMYTSILQEQRTNIDVSKLLRGLYIIQLSKGHKICRQKFIKQ